MRHLFERLLDKNWKIVMVTVVGMFMAIAIIFVGLFGTGLFNPIEK